MAWLLVNYFAAIIAHSEVDDMGGIDCGRLIVAPCQKKLVPTRGSLRMKIYFECLCCGSTRLSTGNKHMYGA